MTIKNFAKNSTNSTRITYLFFPINPTLGLQYSDLPDYLYAKIIA